MPALRGRGKGEGEGSGTSGRAREPEDGGAVGDGGREVGGGGDGEDGLRAENLPESDGEFSLFGGDDGDDDARAGGAAVREDPLRRAPAALALAEAATTTSSPAAADGAAEEMAAQKPGSSSSLGSAHRHRRRASRAPQAEIGSDGVGAAAAVRSGSARAVAAGASGALLVAGTSAPFARIEDSPASAVKVRSGPDYKRNGHKVPSGASLYEPRAVDVVTSPARGRLLNVAKTLMRMPDVDASRRSAAASLGLPVFFVVNVLLPTKAPGVFGGGVGSEDAGVSVVFTFALREAAALPPATDPGVRLARAFFAGGAPGRFKLIGFLDNLSAMGVPGILARTLESFNGKPVIVHKTGAFFLADPDVCECDVNVHEFPYLVKSSLASLRSRVRHAVLRAAFVLQGESDDELPERLLGCAVVRGLDLERPAVVG